MKKLYRAVALLLILAANLFLMSLLNSHRAREKAYLHNWSDAENRCREAQEITMESLNRLKGLIDKQRLSDEKMIKLSAVCGVYGYSAGQQGLPVGEFVTNSAALVAKLMSATNFDFTIELGRRSITNLPTNMSRRL